MNPQIETQARFTYKGFEPDHPTQKRADQVIADLIQLLPTGSVIAARAEFDGIEYCCSIDVFKERESQYVVEVGSSPLEVIGLASDSIIHELRDTVNPNLYTLRTGINPDVPVNY